MSGMFNTASVVTEIVKLILDGGYEPPRPQRLAGTSCVNICVLIALWDKRLITLSDKM